jgi:CubicO group peptidase (beta-lactamase class C family)
VGRSLTDYVPSVVRPDLQALVADLVARPVEQGVSLAMVVVHAGEVVAEWYGVQPDSVFGPGGPVTAETRLASWSMAKSMTHAAVGIAVADGLLTLDEPAPVPAWRGTDKEAITLVDLLEMRPGLRFVEDYVDGDVSHCIAMLFGEGADDHAAYAAALPLDHPPGAVWNYSSGTTNIVSRILGDAVGGGEAGMRRFLRERLFDPAGMHSAEPRFDAAGTWVGSSYVDATARDFARFGELYLHDGCVDERRVLPAGWVDHARTFVAHDPVEGVPGGFDYGRHWWMWPPYPESLAAHGYEGQYVVVLPDRDLVMVHLGKTEAAQRHHVVAGLRAVADAVE